MRVGANIFWPWHKICVSEIANDGNYKKSMYKLNFVGKLEKTHTKNTENHQKWSTGALSSSGFAPYLHG